MAKYRFGDICKVLNGRAYKQNELLASGKYPILRVGNFFSSDRWYYSDMELPEDKYCDYEDLLFAWSASFGPKIWDGEKVIYHYHIWKLIPNDDIADKWYLYYWLRHSVNRLTAGTHGSVMAHMTKGDMENQSIELPSLQTQRKISSILRTIDEKIHNNVAINNNLEQQAQALYRSWFVNYEPFDGTKPADWIDGTIDDLGTEIICGKTPSTKKSEYYGGNTPFITIPDMHGCVYNVSTERYLSAAGVASQPKKTLPPNTVCVSCIGTAGLVTLVSEESQSNQQINSIIPKEGISAYYIYLLMQTLAETINKLGQSGSTIVNLNKTQFGKIQIMIPSKRVLQNFDSLCNPLFDRILSNQKENIKLSELHDTLLPKLMSGELDVSNIEI